MLYFGLINNNETMTARLLLIRRHYILVMIPAHRRPYPLSTESSQRARGFTLLEMLVVVAIIAVLAMMAVPSKGYRHIQLQIVETLELVEPATAKVTQHYALNGSFPDNNEAVGMPEPDKYIGNYLSELKVEKGAIHLRLGQKSPEMLQGKILTLQPVYVKDSPLVPASWICGYDSVPSGMNAAGDNLTDVPVKYLPLRCRK
ncbi:pilin [Pseudomaricurvus sp.]|uniref:pilin n=1 Tax=Pseudomaricurvus sp. TaxID=2004510 RepID=UPI003F6BB784